MINFKLVSTAILLEISSLATAILQSGSDWVLLLFLLQHAAASAIIGTRG